MASELAQARKTAATRAALAVTTEVRQEIRRVVPSGRLKVGRNGARVGARYDMRGDEAVVKAVGPLHLVERDTKAHEIQPKKKGRGRNAKRGGGIKLADGNVRGLVRHPGTTGRHPFAKGVDAGRPKAVRVLRSVTTDAVKRGMRA